jgi:hypothetical protein
MSDFIAVFTDREGTEHYISRTDVPGFTTLDMKQAERFESERSARVTADLFSNITIRHEGVPGEWRSDWIVSTRVEPMSEV